MFVPIQGINTNYMYQYCHMQFGDFVAHDFIFRVRVHISALEHDFFFKKLFQL